MIDNNQYFPALTGFRAVAAWVVFAHHYNPFSRESSIGFLSDLLHESYIGVSLFFVLSGFLITIRYDDRTRPRVTFRQYLRNRFARIYPLFFLLTTITFLVLIPWNTWQYFVSVTLIQGFVDQWKFTGISQAWSLTVEETFYLLAPLIFILIRRVKFPWLLPFAFLVIGVVIYAPSGSFNFMVLYTFFGRSFDFFAGIILAKVYQQRGHTINNKQLFTSSGILGVLLCVVLLALVRGDARYGVFTTPGLIIHHLVLPASTALLLWGLLVERSWVQRFLSNRVMKVLGKTSYAFYLIHLGFIAAWLSYLISSNALVLFVLLNIVAIALYYGVERPLQRLFRAG